MSSGANSDTCYLAGLLHDVGKPIIVAMLLEAEKQLKKPGWVDVSTWTSTVEQGHRKVGVALATNWKLPEEVTAGIRDCSGYDTANQNGAANIVRFANALAKREGFATSAADPAEVTASIATGCSMLGVKESDIENMVAGLAERVAQAA
jgi:putative nucleotidyltransferase with HDIG domain